MTWTTEGRKVNPLAGALLADTGPLGIGGSMNFVIIGSSTVVGFAVLQLRDSNNQTTIAEQYIDLGNATNMKFENMAFGDSQRFRIVVDLAIVGSVQAGIFY